MLISKDRAELSEGLDVSPPNPSLCLSIRDLLLEEVSKDVLEESPAIKELAGRMRRELDIYPMTKREPFGSVGGVDAGSQIMSLASRRYGVISALACSFPGGRRLFLPPESLSAPYTVPGNRFRGTVNVRREAKLYETALGFVETCPELELLLVDGPLVFSNWWNLSGLRRDRQRLIDAVNGLLEACRDEGVVVAGVVKRPSARYLIYALGMKEETDLSDSFLLLQALRPGERTDIFSPRAAMRQASRSRAFIDAIDCPIYSFYGRLSREWSIPPIRIDLPAHFLGHLDDVADYCYASSFWEGIPLPIVRADEEVRVSRRFMGEIYSEIVSRVGRRRGEVSHLAPYWGEGKWMGA